MNIVEQCELEFQTGRKAGRGEAIQSLSTHELVDELCKRKGVEMINVPDERKWYTTVTDDDGFGEFAGKGYGEATILVIKK